ncbi:RKM1 Ribosomal lysine N-methyltransferase 1 [Candida maltosa Xu316]|uniref:Protein-lysine N-methyltransferase n=1 Tax=Candida maltosa (strain Xu316) TaxID=1245528 RepID=M3K1X7_CANMX|nr:hypothetical protein G210_0002 [Candida maltosa Xu316]
MAKLDKINSLVKWAEANGAEISPDVQFKELSTDNIGAIYKGTEKPDGASYPINIPFKIIITPKTATSNFGESFKNISDSQANSILKLYLCRERINPDSFYHPYLQLLPNLAAIDSPCTWSAADKALLQGTNLGNSLKENLASLVEEWWSVINLLQDEVPKPEQHYVNMKYYYEYKFYTDDDLDKYLNDEDIENWTSFPNYLWASLILKSRSFPAYLINQESFNKSDAMLLPVVDLLNHNPQAKVNWDVSDGFFKFKSESIVPGNEIFNNYGLKGNEELLLAYGFCIENNPRDSVALKIKLPEEKIKEIENYGVKLPSIEDYTNSVVDSETKSSDNNNSSNYKDGILFFINQENIPESLIQTFQFLVQNSWEKNGEISLRMQLSGLNHLRAALETKKSMLKLDTIPKDGTTKHNYIKWYIESQSKIFTSAIKQIKGLEKELLSTKKSQLITLKNVYKKDTTFQQSLLFLGFSDYDSILESQFQDQCWLLWLIRCYNRDQYDIESSYLPEWISVLFTKLRNDTDITAQDVINYKPIYENLVPDLSVQVPEVYGKGNWTLSEFIIAAKLLDLISFVRGKEQECILVEQTYAS